MKYETGDIWEWHSRGIPIVIPVNIGFTRAGLNVMGRGVARQAKKRYPELPQLLGLKCMAARETTPVIWWKQRSLILFPTKPFNQERPWFSWHGKSDLALIERSAEQLSRFPRKYGLAEIVLPLVGCGNGALSPADVLPVLEKYLGDEFSLVTWGTREK